MINPIMCHVVAGYPSFKECVSFMNTIDRLGIASIEVQIPFSDPIADGETVMAANDVAVSAGMTVQKSFDLIKESQRCGLVTDIKVMSYFQKVNSFGIKEFVDQSQLCGVSGLIIPDLPYDTAEYSQLKKFADTKGIHVIPVLSPGMARNRLQNILQSLPKSIYVTSQKGITGNAYKNSPALKQLVKEIRRQSPDSEIMLGFGISTVEEIFEAQKIVDIAVVGSAVVREINSGGIDAAASFVNKLINGVSK